VPNCLTVKTRVFIDVFDEQIGVGSAPVLEGLDGRLMARSALRDAVGVGGKRRGPHGLGKIYGQEKNITTYNLARMNMLLHGVKDTEFEIFHGDTLTNDWEMLRGLNPAKKPAFDAIVANPPFSRCWDPTDALADDVRFKNHCLAPKSAADFAFLLYGFHFLKDEGVMATILPPVHPAHHPRRPGAV